MKIYAINLPRSHERREHILMECARFGLEPEIFPGVDGREPGEIELKGLVFEPALNPLTPPEIGCALSHLGIYRDMIVKDIPRALILEDDNVFRTDPRPLLAGLKCAGADAPDAYLLTHRGNQYICGNFSRFTVSSRFMFLKMKSSDCIRNWAMHPPRFWKRPVSPVLKTKKTGIAGISAK